MFKGKPLDQLTIPDFKAMAADVFRNIEPDPKKRTFGGCVTSLFVPTLAHS
jgi:hypothetical protein